MVGRPAIGERNLASELVPVVLQRLSKLVGPFLHGRMIRVVGKLLEIRVRLFERLDGPARPHVDVEKLKTSARRFRRSQDDGPKEVLLGLARPRQPVVGRSEDEMIVGARVAQSQPPQKCLDGLRVILRLKVQASEPRRGPAGGRVQFVRFLE